MAEESRYYRHYREPVEGTPLIRDNVGDAPDYDFETVVVWARDYFGDATAKGSAEGEMRLEVYEAGTPLAGTPLAGTPEGNSEARPLFTKSFAEGYLTLRIPTDLPPGLYDMRGIREGGTPEGSEFLADYWIRDVFLAFTGAFLYHRDLHETDFTLSDGNFKGTFPLYKFSPTLYGNIYSIEGEGSTEDERLANDVTQSLTHAGHPPYIASGLECSLSFGYTRQSLGEVVVSSGEAFVGGRRIACKDTRIAVPQEPGVYSLLVSGASTSALRLTNGTVAPGSDVLVLGRVVRDRFVGNTSGRASGRASDAAATLRGTFAAPRHPLTFTKDGAAPEEMVFYSDGSSSRSADGLVGGFGYTPEYLVESDADSDADILLSGLSCPASRVYENADDRDVVVYGESEFVVVASGRAEVGQSAGISVYVGGVGGGSGRASGCVIARAPDVFVHLTDRHVVLVSSGRVAAVLPRPEYTDNSTKIEMYVSGGSASLSFSVSGERDVFTVGIPVRLTASGVDAFTLLPGVGADGIQTISDPDDSSSVSESRTPLKPLSNAPEWFDSSGYHAFDADGTPGGSADVLWQGAYDPDDITTYSEPESDIRSLYEYPAVRIVGTTEGNSPGVTAYGITYTLGSESRTTDGIPDAGYSLFGLPYGHTPNDDTPDSTTIRSFTYARTAEVDMGNSTIPDASVEPLGFPSANYIRLSPPTPVPPETQVPLSEYADGTRDADLIASAALAVRTGKQSGTRSGTRSGCFVSPFPYLDIAYGASAGTSIERTARAKAARDAFRRFCIFATSIGTPDGVRAEIDERLFREDLAPLDPADTLPDEILRAGEYESTSNVVYPVFSCVAHPPQINATTHLRPEDVYPAHRFVRAVEYRVGFGAASDEGEENDGESINAVLGNLEGLYARFSGGFPYRDGAVPAFVNVKLDPDATPMQQAGELSGVLDWARSFEPVRGVLLDEPYPDLPPEVTNLLSVRLRAGRFIPTHG